jgi:hypothetical protein
VVEMNRYLALILLVGTTVCAQEQVPTVLLGAAHCLSNKGFLPLSKATELSLGYLDDTKSYPGDEVLYVVVYGGPRRSDGWVFSVFLSQKNGRRIFSIQNNAKFVRSSKEGVAFRKEGVDFVVGGDPLGGVWTQEHIAKAIQRIERKPKFTVRVKDLLEPPALTQCESYADRR